VLRAPPLTAGAPVGCALQEQRIDDEIESVKALSAQQFAALTEAKVRGTWARLLARLHVSAEQKKQRG
jgi:hypothetical protein